MQHRGSQINQVSQFLDETQDLSLASCQGHHVVAEIASSLPFEFIIPKSLISPQSDISSEYLSLLPSVEQGYSYVEPSTGHKFMQPRVSYSITASLAHVASERGLKVGREICISPIISASPPLQLEYFPDEYQTTCSQLVKGKRWTGPIGELAVSAAEPPPLNISTCEPRATTTVSVRLLYTPRKASSSIVPPYEWKVTVKSYLQIRTFLTTKPFTPVPTQDKVKNTSMHRLISTKTLPETRECDTLSWRLHRISNTGTITPDVPLNPWTSTLLVPVNASKSMVPTFLCPISAIRYAVILEFSVTGLCHGRLCLKIPIVLINDPEDVVDSVTGQSSREGLKYDMDNVGEGITAVSLEDAEFPNPQELVKPPPYERGKYVRRARRSHRAPSNG